MCFVHYGSAITLLALIWHTDWIVFLKHQYVSFNSSNVPVTVAFQDSDAGTIYLGRMVAVASIISGTHHLTVWLFRTKYNIIVQQVAVLRWCDYAITSPLLFSVLSCLAGVYNIETVVLLAQAQAVVIILGALSETMLLYGQTAGAWSACILSSGVQVVLFGITWSVLISSQPPWWVHLIYGVMASLFGAFGILYILYLAGKINNRITLDVYFTMLSAVAKVGLQWMLWSGVRARSGSIQAINVTVSCVIIGGILLSIFFYFFVERGPPRIISTYSRVRQ